MAELLIQAKPHWMDNFTQEQIDALSNERKVSRNARIQLGDIVVIKPDGWEWGNEENLPRYIVIKAPGVSVETVEHLTQPLMDNTNPENPVMLKKRKYQIPQGWMNTHLNQDVVVLSQAEIDLVMANITEKTE